ncbi:MAG: D-alanyl-D-alanine carboxypeptidase [Candidatus Omnitrophica bacterium]|nr:D-alanyl-D-alanine carboxypeptidase [Candidatus Omnitrophota bacterium]
MIIKKIKHIVVFSLIFILICSTISLARQRRGYRGISCRSVIFSDSTTGERLYGKDVSRRVLPASTTKVMTALLVLENVPLDRYVTVRNSATFVQPTKLNLIPGEQYKIADLLYAAVMNSANDASIVLAEAVAGTEPRFVAMMNQRARQLGALNTQFSNPHGLPSRGRAQYTTAFDMYLIFKEALKYDFFRQAIKFNYKTIYSKEGRKIVFKSHNNILFKGWNRNVYGKTGYTRTAGACFVGTIQKGNDTLIIGVFNCPKRWDDIKYIVSRFGHIPL